MKSLRLCFLSVLVVFTASVAHASNPCESVLCMAGKVEGQSGGASCSGPIADYFNIVEYGKHGKFSPSSTAAARLNFLNSCGSGAGNWPTKINAVYGTTLL